MKEKIRFWTEKKSLCCEDSEAATNSSFKLISRLEAFFDQTSYPTSSTTYHQTSHSAALTMANLTLNLSNHTHDLSPNLFSQPLTLRHNKLSPRPEVSETLGFETETETRVVSVLVSRFETTPLKTESQSQCLRPQIKSLSISLTV